MTFAWLWWYRHARTRDATGGLRCSTLAANVASPEVVVFAIRLLAVPVTGLHRSLRFHARTGTVGGTPGCVLACRSALEAVCAFLEVGKFADRVLAVPVTTWQRSCRSALEAVCAIRAVGRFAVRLLAEPVVGLQRACRSALQANVAIFAIGKFAVRLLAAPVVGLQRACRSALQANVAIFAIGKFAARLLAEPVVRLHIRTGTFGGSRSVLACRSAPVALGFCSEVVTVASTLLAEPVTRFHFVGKQSVAGLHRRIAFESR